MELDPTFLFEAQPERWLRRVPGRETFVWPQQGSPRYVVKRTRGDSWRERLFESLHRLSVRSPAQREHENLQALAALGLLVPRAVACWTLPGARSLLLMDYVPHQNNLREHLEQAQPQEFQLWFDCLLDIVVRLHASGWYHRDLYLQHFLPLDQPRRLLLLDVGRARCQARPRRRWWIKDLAALAHSLPAHIQLLPRLRFLVAYLDRRQIYGRRRRRRWLRAIESRRLAMARHRPRYGESAPHG